eukprot:GGOE01008802.1.p1 GENE.GGOE01008802.1~~GGOE01008802.1.p1  ORF type:complete len:108 (-),score=10.90 GGOE01008802.1:42-365(-)
MPPILHCQQQPPRSDAQAHGTQIVDCATSTLFFLFSMRFCADIGGAAHSFGCRGNRLPPIFFSIALCTASPSAARPFPAPSLPPVVACCFPWEGAAADMVASMVLNS